MTATKLTFFIDIVNLKTAQLGVQNQSFDTFYKKYLPVLTEGKVNLSTCTNIVANSYLLKFKINHTFNVEKIDQQQKKIIASRLKVNKLIQKLNKKRTLSFVTFFVFCAYLLIISGFASLITFF